MSKKLKLSKDFSKDFKEKYIDQILSNKKISLEDALNSDYKFLFVSDENAEKFLQYGIYKLALSIDHFDSRIVNAPIVICSPEGKEEIDTLVIFEKDDEEDEIEKRREPEKSRCPIAYI